MSADGLVTRFYPESRLGGFTDVDGTVRFYQRVNALLQPYFIVADVGCGRGAHGKDPCAYRRDLQILRGKCREVIGMDVDPAAEENPFIDQFHLLQGHIWPLKNASMDMVLSDFVLEHITNPPAFFSEVARVLKPGGYFCFRTTNKSGYVALMAMVIPNRFHSRVVGRAQHDREAQDVFPTVYQANTVWRIRALFRQYGFDGHVSGWSAEPSYFAFSSALFRLGMLLDGFTPGWFKTSLFAYARKQNS